MIVLGSNSEIAQAFVEKILKEGERFENIYLLTSNKDLCHKFMQHLEVKYGQSSEIIELDLLNATTYDNLKHIESDLLFCATGYLGKNSAQGLYDNDNTQRIIDVNYAKLVPLINYFSEKMEKNGKGHIIALSSVAGERGRQSNFVYGSAKAGFTAYLSGLRNYLYHKGVSVTTIKPGFMATKMTEDLELPSKLTASPEQASHYIYKAYKKKKNIAYVLPIWGVIMFVIRNIPEFIFKKLKM